MDINVIIGPPCAGKSTYIKENATQGDVLIDYDAMAMALGAGSTHTASGAIREVALRLRYSAINKILEGISAPAWIIHTNPRQSLIDDYAEAGAVFTIVDPGKAVCLERVEKDYRPEGTAEVIEAWYESPPKIPQQMDIDAAALLKVLGELKALCAKDAN